MQFRYIEGGEIMLLYDLVDRIDAIAEEVTGLPDPPHEVTEPDHHAALVASMAARGWVGPPLVVEVGG